MQQPRERNYWKIGGIGCLAIFALIAVLLAALVALAAIGASVDTGSTKPAHHEPQPKVEQSAHKSEDTQLHAVKTEQAVRDAAGGYYAAAEQGNYNYTYDHLASETKNQFTYDSWSSANESLNSSGITYHVGEISFENNVKAAVNITLSTGESRTTYFVNQGGQWLHQLSEEEYALFVGSGSASATASASASAEPVQSGSVARDSVKVVVSANKPVDVSILSVKDGQVPMIEEETSGNTYEFGLKPGADLQVVAMDPKMDIYANDDISIKVYINGQLKTQDTDDMSALVEF